MNTFIGLERIYLNFTVYMKQLSYIYFQCNIHFRLHITFNIALIRSKLYCIYLFEILEHIQLGVGTTEPARQN